MTQGVGNVSAVILLPALALDASARRLGTPQVIKPFKVRY